MGQPGRPALDPNDRSVPINISFPAKQLTALTNKAKAERYGSVQELIRKTMAAADQQK